MTDYKAILRLNAKGISRRAISTSLKLNKRTVSDCINRAESHGLSSQQVEEQTNEMLFAQLYQKNSIRDERYEVPDCLAIDEELKKPDMTLILLWNRYASACMQNGRLFYKYSQYCEYYRRHVKEISPSLRIDRRPGESLELDWAGSVLHVHDPVTGLPVRASVFVAALAFSAYFYAEAFLNQKVVSWIMGNEHALRFFDGVTLILTPDNLKTAVIKADRYEPDLHEAYLEFAEYYGTMIIPARVRKPKDKSVVEGTVGFITRRIIADLQGRMFFSLDELNTAIWERMDILNEAPFTKKPGSRVSLFNEVEKQYLSPLPPIPYQFFERKEVTVAPDLHIQFDKSFYSVPWKHIRNKVLVKATATTVTVVDESGKQIAVHDRSLHPNQKITDPNHLPANIREVSSWNGATFRRRASVIGPNAEAIIERILQSREYEVQSYRSCLGVLNLLRKNGRATLEKACARALELGVYSYKSIKAIISAIEAETDDTVPVPANESDGDEDLQRFFCCHDEHGNSFLDAEAKHGHN